MQNAIVIDLGYGDSGKGLTVDWLASTFEYNTVVRYSGGSQCGHGVRHEKRNVPKGLFHEFQTWGSGTLRGINCAITKDVVFDPILIWKEYVNLNSKMSSVPHMIIHPDSPVITPYDVYANQNSSSILDHGTCGRGIFTTKTREKAHYHIHAGDLFYPSVLEMKLEELKKYYGFPRELENNEVYDIDLSEFYQALSNIRTTSNFVITSNWKSIEENGIIFESSQGLMLDEQIGIFPHCTPSKLDIPEGREVSDVYIITRAYHTRHGNGPLSTEEYPIKRSEWETNFDNAYQGMFRLGILDLDVLSYALTSSNIIEYVKNNPQTRIHLVITHMDVVDGDWRVMRYGQVTKYPEKNSFVGSIIDAIENNLLNYVNLDTIYTNDSPFAGHITEFDRNSLYGGDPLDSRFI